MAKVSALGLALLAGIFAAAPAAAVKDMTGLSEPTRLVVSRPVHRAAATAESPSLAGMPASADWLMILVGFGLLGALNRRSTSDRLRDEMVL